mgnify:CR=1 FL=1
MNVFYSKFFDPYIILEYIMIDYRPFHPQKWYEIKKNIKNKILVDYSV